MFALSRAVYPGVQNMARIVEQTNEDREKAVEAKKDLQQQATQKKDRLKAAFLKKQLDSLKAIKKGSTPRAS